MVSNLLSTTVNSIHGISMAKNLWKDFKKFMMRFPWSNILFHLLYHFALYLTPLFVPLSPTWPPFLYKVCNLSISESVLRDRNHIWTLKLKSIVWRWCMINVYLTCMGSVVARIINEKYFVFELSENMLQYNTRTKTGNDLD